MKVHPAAEAYRMMTPDELQALAADIAENGLLDPILTKMHEGEPAIVDGRNRFDACALAGVEPRFEDIGDRDPVTIVASRGQRRNVSKGQQAIALAMLFPEAEKGGRCKKALETSGFSRQRLGEARLILRVSPEDAIAIRDGIRPFDEALKEAQEKQRALRSKDEKLGRLRQAAPDLAELVEEERLKLDDAINALDARDAEKIAAERNARETILRVCEMAVSVTGLANDEFVAGVDERLADKEFKQTLAARLRIAPESVGDIKVGAENLLRVVTKLIPAPKKKKGS